MSPLTVHRVDVVQPTIEIVEVAAQGPPGPQNLFVQANDPEMVAPGLWIQTGLEPAGAGLTFWVEDGT
jgi:hypothetical protein